MSPKKIIGVLYSFLFFLVPLILYPYTSELFEFNKMIVVYIVTVLIVFTWLYRCINERRLIFRRTILDIPILVFLASQMISTLLSLDFRTSLLGYYSRFNGGLISIICYSLLYWAYVSNLGKRDVFISLRMAIISTILASIYAVLEHFGIDKNLWIQDVQNRVFSTFGQPNWLAAWLVAILPVTQAVILETNRSPDENERVNPEYKKNKSLQFLNKYLIYLISLLFFLTLLYTKSRSGIIGFAVSQVVFWGIILIIKFKNKPGLKSLIKPFLFTNLIYLTVIIFTGTPWTPSVQNLIQRQSLKAVPSVSATTQTAVSAPALEIGGSSSAEIRRIVWKGAIDVWKNYPLFGSGVETFAFSYYKFRPKEHNLVSEWDFLYNKAHNEYLNFMATTGTVGIISYFILILFSMLGIVILYKKQNSQEESVSNVKNKIPILDFRNLSGISFWQIGFLAGYISILITNFFGFSVVPVNLLFFLFPAMAVSLYISDENDAQKTKYHNISGSQKVELVISAFIALFLINSTIRYWYADVLYNKADLLEKSGNLIDSVKKINSAIKLSPHEAIFYDKLASSLTDIALVYKKQENDDAATKYAENAIKTVQKAEAMSPNNLNIIRNKARISIKLSDINSSYILEAKKALLRGIDLAPTDAKLYYNLSLTYYRIGEVDKAEEILVKTIDLKPNYKDALYAYAVLLSEKGEKEKARGYLQYILDHLDPLDVNAKKALETI